MEGAEQGGALFVALEALEGLGLVCFLLLQLAFRLFEGLDLAVKGVEAFFQGVLLSQDPCILFSALCFRFEGLYLILELL